MSIGEEKRLKQRCEGDKKRDILSHSLELC